MSSRPVVQRGLPAGAALFLLVLGWKTLSGGLRQIPRARTPGQKVESLVQIVNGLLGFLALAASFRPGRWSPPLRRAWGVSLAAAAGGAEVAERAISIFDYPGEMPVRAPLQSERQDCLVYRIDAGEAFAITREVDGKIGYPTPVLEKALGVPVTTRGWTTFRRLVRKHGETRQS